MAQVSHPHLPAGRAESGGLQDGLQLCHGTHWLRLRPKEHNRFDALSGSAAGAAAVAPAYDCAGLGDPTRIICYALIAQAFEVVRYPILPKVTQLESEVARREIM